ncbi:MAG: UvrD-helicase domain-containing protein [Armatimonadetes bacterium]|nr:UvrD-helicase domain-containing protein [Armatimonadota bacterium]
MNWNDQQRAAITSSRDHLVVVASAGAGKTEVIVQRYLRYVEEVGLSPTEILAVTYTHRAAASMKLRICRELRKRGLDSAAQEAETGPIQTIHSFYERVLRENAVWSGLDPDFEIIGEADAGRLWDMALREALGHPDCDTAEVRAYRQTSAGKRKWKSFLDLDSLMRHQVIGLLVEPARNQAWTWRRLGETFSCAGDVSAMFDRLVDDPDWPRGGGQPLGVKARNYGRNPKGHLSGIELDQEVDLFLGLVKLGAKAWEIYEQRLESRGQMDFALLERRALDLLEGDPEIRHRIRQRTKVILLDESQDANLNQFRFLESLGVSGSLTVGDQKQSIYGFRGSAVDEFLSRVDDEAIRLEANYRSQPGIVGFVNHVFAAEWGVFYEPMASGKDGDPAGFAGVEVVESQKDTAARDAAWIVGQMLESGTPPGEVVVLAQSRYGLAAIKDRLDSLGIASEASGSTESLFTRMEARDMANLLDCCADSGNDYALACLLHSPYVGLSLDSVVMLGQKPGIYEQLEGFDYPVEGDRDKVEEFLGWFKGVRAFCDRFSAFEIVNRAFTYSPYLPALGRMVNGERNIANARKLLVLATAMPDLTPIQLADRLRHLQAVAGREPLAPLHDPGDPVVRLMTAHRSKGLEFENVVLYGPDFRVKQREDKVEANFRAGVAFTQLKGKNLVCDAVRALNRSEQGDEELRLLYVACTRAKERLILCTFAPDVKGREKSTLHRLLSHIPRGDYAKLGIRHHPCSGA